MKITLELVRQILRQLLGFESFTARFITKTIEDENNASVSITREGRLSYNPEFVEKYVQSKKGLFSLVFHEILHPLFCHFMYGMGKLENVAADAVINAVLTMIYEDESDEGNLFKRVYPPEGLSGILRPGSNLEDSPIDECPRPLKHISLLCPPRCNLRVVSRACHMSETHFCGRLVVLLVLSHVP